MNFWKDVYRGRIVYYAPELIAALCANMHFGGPANMEPANRSFLRWYFPTLAYQGNR